MRKMQFITGLVAFCSGLSYAQKPNLGLKFGADVYKTSGSHMDNEYRTFPYGGAYLGLEFGKISFNIEGLFTQTKLIAGNDFNTVYQGYIQNGKQQIKNGEFQFTELSLPFLVGFKLMNALWVQLGPQYTNVVQMRDRDEVLTEMQKVYRDGYVSGVAGLKIQLPFKLHASGRYVLGITDRNNTNVNERWSTSHWQVGLGWGW